MNKLLLFIMLAGILSMTLNGCSPQTTIQSPGQYKVNIPSIAGDTPPVEFEQVTSFPQFTDKAKIYEMSSPEITQNNVIDLAAKFGISGDISFGSDNIFHMGNKGTQTSFDVYPATGTFRYSLTSKLFPREKPDLPSNEEAMKIATDFLVERNLLPEGDEASGVAAGGELNGGPSHLLVSFKHKVDLCGPGAKHGVRIGNKGEVIDVFINPTNPLKLPIKDLVNVRSAEQGFSEMKLTRKYLVPSETKKIKIDNIKLAYWLESIDKKQEYIAPVYVFEGQCIDDKGKQLKDKFIGYAEAVK